MTVSDMYREMFNPTREELIAGYKKQIDRKEEEIHELKMRILMLKAGVKG